MWPSPASLILTAVVVVGVLAFPWLNPGYRALSFAVTTGVTAIVLYGMAIPFGQAGIMSLGYAGLMGFGAYTAAILSRDFGLNMWEAMPFSALVAALCGGTVRSAFVAHQRASFRDYDLCHVRTLAHCSHERRQVHRRRERDSTCRLLGPCWGSSWINCRTPTCWWRASCS